MKNLQFDPSIPQERREELTALLLKLNETITCAAVIPAEENLRLVKAHVCLQLLDENGLPIMYNTNDPNVLLFLEGTPESQQHQALLAREIDEEIKLQEGDTNA